MWPLITSALAALLWLLQVSLANEPDMAGWSTIGSWLKPLAMGLSALAVAQILQGLVVQLLGGSRRPRIGPGPDLLQSVLSILLYTIVALSFVHWGLNQDLGSVLATSALLSAIIGLALQSTLGHLFSGVSIEIEKPLKVGDYIRRDDIEGQVVLLSWRSVHVRTDRGSTIILPNSEFANRALEVVRADEAFRHTVTFNISSEHAPGQIIRIAMQVLHSDLPDVCSSPAPSVVLISNDPASGSTRYGARMFTMQFLDRSSMASAFMERLWYALSREGLTMPTPPAGLLWPSGSDGNPADTPPIRFGQAPVRAEPLRAEMAQIPALSGLSETLRQRLLDAARLQHYGRHEKCPGDTLKLLVKGRLRQPQAHSEAETGAELQQLVDALASTQDGSPSLRMLEQNQFNALLHHGSLALGPVAQSLCERIASLTDDPWLAWHAYAHAIKDSATRQAFLRHAPAQATRALHPGAWLGWSLVLARGPADESYASQHCSLLSWEPGVFKAILRQAHEEDRARLLQDLQQHASGCAELKMPQLNAWLEIDDANAA